MPMYLGKAVTDEYLQNLVKHYRDAYEAVTGNAEDADQPIIDRLEAEKVVTEKRATELGTADGHATLTA